MNAYIAAHAIDPKADLSDWAPDAEQTLTDAISKGIDADRVAAMKKELDAGRGSFK